MARAILGISAYYHDSAAALVVDGKVVAAAQQERFSRIKYDPRFPADAINFVLNYADLTPDQIEAVVFYDKPMLKFERLLETYHAFAPRGFSSFVKAMPVWIGEKLFMRRLLVRELKKLGFRKPRLLFPEHHLSHAAAAFYPSPFESAAVLTIDGVGEWATATICHGQSAGMHLLRQLDFPHSIGLLYAAFTAYCGFKVNSGEYKLMGLAPYADRDSGDVRRQVERILNELVDLRDDGSLRLNMAYFPYATGMTMFDESRWRELFEVAPRLTGGEIQTGHIALAAAIQVVTEDILLRLSRSAHELTGERDLCLAGGVALNCVANGRLLRSGLFDRVWIQPAAGDAGGALGAALAGWHIALRQERNIHKPDGMEYALLGPGYSKGEVDERLSPWRPKYEKFSDFENLCRRVAALLDAGKVVGWFQGRMEFGPRALGNRSILADPRSPGMQRKLNLAIKKREGFRPFAPVVLLEHARRWFDLDVPSPYMLFTAPVRQARLKNSSVNPSGSLSERLNQPRSEIPAVTHVDNSARVQTVTSDANPRLYRLLESFYDITGCPVLVNTSFNVRGEPIVCTPEEAYRCFMRTEMDFLVIGDYLYDKTSQPLKDKADLWEEAFEND
ncbi:MAG TPA: carbamoyltransferase [candidate division Zixibacteria bacterium]|nr:carbamoyltransferase [candidate division Zixibacteria bacterium]